MQMLETLMAGSEYVNTAKRAGVYASVLQWIAAYRRGEAAPWPGAVGANQHYSQQFASSPSHQTHQMNSPVRIPPTNVYIPQMNEPRKVVKENTLAAVPLPKRALDTLHESYRILNLDDSKSLSHELLKGAYKRAAAKAHPDRGGSAAAFDEVTRAYLYLEEVINKLVPRGSKDGDDPRFAVAVTKEVAIKAREGPLTKYDEEEAAHRRPSTATTTEKHEGPKVSLNPKNLNMSVFNQLFEENRMPNPDQDGYGDWLKSSGEDRRLQNETQLRSKFNADIFNKTFKEQGIGRGSVGSDGEGGAGGAGGAMLRHQAPDAITHHNGTELGGGRPSHFISPMGARTGYTDLKYAYGEGSTFSQEVSGIQEEKRSFDTMKRERESAPVPLTGEEHRILNAIERQKTVVEEDRRRRMAVQDVESEDVYAKMQRRLMIQ